MAIPTKKQPINKNSKPPKITYTQLSEIRRNLPQADNHALVKASPEQLPLSRNNFIMMIVAAVLIVLGFLLMLGSGSTPEQFNADIFSTTRSVIAPTITFLGFVFMGIAIIKKPKTTDDKQKADTAINGK